jgi:tetratricopeptide (TPR) repeat protein
LGLAHYRAGQHDEAIEVLRESNKGNWLSTAKAQNHLVLAMAHYAAGRQAEAREWLQRARGMIDKAQRMTPKKALRLAPPDWIALAVLFREAEEKIEGSRRKGVIETVEGQPPTP